MEAEGNEAEDVFQIVGVVGDTRYGDIKEDQRLIAFLPADQDAKPGSDRTFVIRGRGSLDSLQAAILREATRGNPDLLVEFHVLDTQIQQSVSRERLMANLSLAFGVLAGLLSTLGLYGVMSYLVVRRRSEIGLRMALGATQGNVYRLIAKDATVMVAMGLALGVGASLSLAKYAESMLFGLKAKDPLSSGFGGIGAGDDCGGGDTDPREARGTVGADGGLAGRVTPKNIYKRASTELSNLLTGFGAFSRINE